MKPTIENHQCGSGSGVEFHRVWNAEPTEIRVMAVTPTRLFGVPAAVNSA